MRERQVRWRSGAWGLCCCSSASAGWGMGIMLLLQLVSVCCVPSLALLLAVTGSLGSLALRWMIWSTS